MTVTHRVPGLILTDHEFQVPIDHTQPAGARLTVFAREAVALDKAQANLPWLVFFQGGPGFGSPRPIDTSAPGWIGQAVKEYRVLLLDQRGTGRSTPISYQSLARFNTPQDQADYLKLFRACRQSNTIPTRFIVPRIRGCARRIACILSVTRMMGSACETSSIIC
jgi:pimeloyl-ACP methyl ester carboxylesterase